MRGKAPAGMTFMAFLAAELEKSNSQSSIQPEDRIFVTALVKSGQDIALAEALMTTQLKSVEDMLVTQEEQRRILAAKKAGFDAEYKNKVDEQAELCRLLKNNQDQQAAILVEIGHANQAIAQEQAFLANGGCTYVVIEWV